MNIFKDKDGKVVVGQTPNGPIILSLILFVLSRWNYLSDYSELLEKFAIIWLVIWALLELISGVNLFRKIIGAITLISILVIIIT